MAVIFTLLALPGGCREGDPQGAPRGGAPVDAARGELRARLVQLTGDVQVKRAAGDEWLPAHETQELFENDKLRTAKGAGALVEFANGSEVRLGEDALVGVSESGGRPGQERTDVTVLRGQVNAELKHPAEQSLSVSTPAATVRAGREIVFQ